eukprot:3188078-Rhodomonas_salina.1
MMLAVSIPSCSPTLSLRPLLHRSMTPPIVDASRPACTMRLRGGLELNVTSLESNMTVAELYVGDWSSSDVDFADPAPAGASESLHEEIEDEAREEELFGYRRRRPKFGPSWFSR